MEVGQARVTDGSIDVIFAVYPYDPLKGLHHAHDGELELPVLLVDGRDVHVVDDCLGVALPESEVAQEQTFEQVVQCLLFIPFAEME